MIFVRLVVLCTTEGNKKIVCFNKEFLCGAIYKILFAENLKLFLGGHYMSV